MTISPFDAFALPSAVAAPERALLGFDEAAVRVRYVDASPEWIHRVADALLAARGSLAARPAASVASALGGVGRRFLDRDDALRAEALALLPATSGLSAEMAAAVLDGMARDWTEERLLTLLRAELGDAEVLDGFRADSLAVGPALCVQVVAGSVPGVGATALVRSLLLKAPTLLKPGRGDVVLPVLFGRALREADPELADALAVVYWPGGEADLESAALAPADVVTVYGSDETVAGLRARAPATARFVGYHHRVSVGVVGRHALRETSVEDTAKQVARAVVMFDQRGCVSPQAIFLESAIEDDPGRFVRALADALAGLEELLPTGPMDAAEASALHQHRGTAELRAAAGEATVAHGGASPWTVVLERGTSPLGPCPGRMIRLRLVSDVTEVPDLIEPLRGHLQTVGVAGLGDRLEGVAHALGRAGASRVAPFSSVAFPPPWWHHDGRGPLRDLVSWVDLERE